MGRFLCTLDEEVSEMLAKLNFFENESRKIFTFKSANSKVKGWEASDQGKGE